MWRSFRNRHNFFATGKEDKTIAKPRNSLLINDEIRYPNVRLIDASGEMRGVVPLQQAKQMAADANLDLVLISAKADNPVCRIMDYGRFAFEQTKREREARRNQKVTNVKEVQLKLTTEEHDLDVKSRNACRFLDNGDRVKVVLRFRGREMAHTHMGYDVMKAFAETCSEIGEVDRPARIEGRNMVMYLSPIKENKRS